MNVAGTQDNTSVHSLDSSLSYEPIHDDKSTRDTKKYDEGREEVTNRLRLSLQVIDQNYIQNDAVDVLEADKSALEQVECADIGDIDAEWTSSQRNVNQDDQRNQDLLPSLVTRKKKKVKNRHVKAAIMIAVIWTVMVGFIVLSLSVEWWSNSCTLCGNDLNLEMHGIEITDWPTRRPSSKGSPASSLFTFLGSPSSLRPPPENIAQVCAPAIYLDYGPAYNGPSVHDLVSTCANTCFPAMCCLINDEQAKRGIIAIWESQGLASQAESYISSIQNCYTDDNVATCDEYRRWCDTLYRLDFALDDTIPTEMEVSCATASDDIVAESSRESVSDKLQTYCSWTCNSLSCCYEAIQNSTETVIYRKRKRQHIHFDTALEVENKPRIQALSGLCQSFTAFKGSLNAKICDAYAPYCHGRHSAHSTIQIPSVTRPTLQSLNPMFTSNTSNFDASSSPTAIFPLSSPSTSSYPLSFTMVSPSYQNLSSSKSSQPTLYLNSTKSQTPTTDTRTNKTSSPGQSMMPLIDFLEPSQTPIRNTSLNVTSSYAPSQQLTSPSLTPTPNMTEPFTTQTTNTETRDA